MFTGIHARFTFIALLATLSCAGTATGGFVSGSMDRVRRFDHQFDDAFDFTQIDDETWLGSYKENVGTFRLDVSSQGVNFDMDSHQSITISNSKWNISLQFRNEIDVARDDSFAFSGTLMHSAGLNLPHPGDEENGDSVTIGFDMKRVDGIKNLTKFPNDKFPGLDGLFYFREFKIPSVKHREDHFDSYKVYYFADLDLARDQIRSYRILIEGVHAVPEPSSVILAVMGGLSFLCIARRRLGRGAGRAEGVL